MRLVLISLLLAITTLSAEYIRQPIDQKLVDSKIKIIDIRTPNEWKTTGIVKGSYPIMFFDEQGNYNVEMFLDKLNKVVKKEEKFALICNSGNRTQTVGTFLGKQLGYNVIDLQGGIQYAIGKKITLEPYKPKP
ncbi:MULTISPECIES: rhodanese-like domain-containing protein [unclassified Sulfuricurvum]|uniref:rhodanese-like domain-containing protein n=1 Tax=unclassified Sulfuricurvum TaxID=2632390 RepID=UPI0002999D96|nr:MULTISPECIES: rhodanese-like domain-containing protein [unclassified Sulfuricurvum]AFV96685.1 rhodanese-like domain-containing protein [Candidatus Sulfuricurvum sp. RIFRC-1]HBM36136.1 rhodanese-like domain-containing protein [Sulfuricurvum sp.]